MDLKSIGCAIKKIYSSVNKLNSKKILYKIIQLSHTNEAHQFTVQCLTSQSVFQISVLDIVLNCSIIYGLHPIQSCLVGLKYAYYLKHKIESQGPEIKPCQNCNCEQALGILQIQYQDRQGNICYLNSKKNRLVTMNPQDIARSPTLIKKFNSEQAFLIGLNAGLKSNNNVIDLQSRLNN